MRNKINNINVIAKIFSLLLIILIVTSCGNVLDDVEDLRNYPGEGTFDDEQTTKAYLAALSRQALPAWPVNEGRWSDLDGSIIGPDAITTDNGTMKYWPYTEVRRVNILLEEVPEGAIAEDKKGPIMGEAKFIRAYHYFKMVYYHGGVPIIKVPQALDDDLEVPRNSTAECFNFIIEDLDDAIAALPEKYRGNNYGRIDKAAAMAFKGRVLLYKASPQFNSSNPYDNSYWTDAYTANKSAIDFLDANGFGLLENYVDIFETEEHKENILSVIFKDPIRNDGRGEQGIRPLTETKNRTGDDQPGWAIAAAYPMLDGKMPGDASSAYAYDVQTYWQDRDPRFAANLVWNGATYELSGKGGRRQYTMASLTNSDDAFGYVIQGSSFYRTGLYCRKGINEANPAELVSANDYDWPEIRYTEVLFNLAEAANETNKSGEAIQILKDIRERAGIEAGTDGMYGLMAGMTRDDVREAILHEKFIEMAWEGHRFWDLRRHRMLDRLDGMRKYGIMVLELNGRTYDQITTEDTDRAGKYEILPEEFTSEVVELIAGSGPTQMSMPETYYFFPIKLSDIDRNPKLEQNTGWGGTFNPEL